VGVLSTSPTKKMVLANPLVVEDMKNPGMTVIRLVESYENILKLAGINSYTFFIHIGSRKWKNLVERAFEIKPYTITDDAYWYNRRLF